MLLEWIDRELKTLPGCRDEFFRKLWVDRRLVYRDSDGSRPELDSIDDYNARLACASIRKRERLLIFQPDAISHRSAVLLATCLLRTWFDHSSIPANPAKTILYIGTNVGIRKQLASVSVQNLNLSLSEVFQQVDLLRGGTAPARFSPHSASSLPSVVTVYSPANIRSLIEQLRPQLITVDIDDIDTAAWTRELLEAATRLDIPVVGWGINHLSESAQDFAATGQVFRWSPSPPEALADLTASVFRPRLVSELQPLVLAGEGVLELSATLQKAAQKLLEVRRQDSSRLVDEAAKQHWTLLRAVGSLCVPFKFHESEVSGLWGLHSINEQRKGCDAFRTACAATNPRVAEQLNAVESELDGAIEQLQSADPPFWRALANLCLEDPLEEGEQRIIVFSGRGRKQMFEMAMLAYHNLSVDDLAEVNTECRTLNELRDLYRKRFSKSSGALSRIRPVQIGLPTQKLTGKLLPAITEPLGEVLLLPHEVEALRQRRLRWNDSLGTNLRDVTDTLLKLRDLVDNGLPPSDPEMKTSRIRLLDPVNLDLGSAARGTPRNIQQFWKPNDPIVEIGKILTENVSEESSIVDRGEFGDQPSAEWVDKAVALSFDNGSSILLSADETVNAVRSNSVEERYVRALRPGDRVMLISSLRKQSLYDLIISRLHQHESMRFGIGLIVRWQSDLVSAFRVWSANRSSPVDELLRKMQDLGSDIISSAAIRAWIAGLILCPQDPLDLHRLAKILGMDFVLNNHEKIGRAAARLRGLHRGFANRINRWIVREAQGNAADNDHEFIDQDLDLTFGDLRSSLLLLTIREISEVQGPFLRSGLGKLEV